MDLLKVTRRFSVILYVIAAAFGLMVMAAHDVEKYESRSAWLTINLPNPPAPLPYTASTSSAEPQIQAQ